MHEFQQLLSSTGAYSRMIVQTCRKFLIVKPNVFHSLVIVPGASINVDLLQSFETTLDFFSSILGNEEFGCSCSVTCRLKRTKNMLHKIRADPRVYLGESDSSFKICCLSFQTSLAFLLSRLDCVYFRPNSNQINLLFSLKNSSFSTIIVYVNFNYDTTK